MQQQSTPTRLLNLIADNELLRVQINRLGEALVRTKAIAIGCMMIVVVGVFSLFIGWCMGWVNFG